MKTFLAAITCTYVLASAAPAQERGTVPIKVERNKTLVTVTIDNVTIPDIIFDTGLSYDALMIYNTAYLDSLNLSGSVVVNIGGAGSGNPQTALMVRSSQFHIGKTAFTNQPLIVFQSDIYKGFPSNGIIGYSVFGHYVTEFDYNDNTLHLHEQGKRNIDTSWTRIPLYFKENMIPWIDASVVIDDHGPVKLSMYLDLAAGDPLVLLEKADMKVSVPRKTSDHYIGRGLSGDIYGKQGTVSKLIIGKFELQSVVASIAAAELRSKQKDADAIIGNGLLRRFNLIFDYANKALYLKPNVHFNEPFQ